jgi:hypothetical protein
MASSWLSTEILEAAASISLRLYSAMSALRIPKAMDDSYNVWYAATVMRASSRTRRSRRPRSPQLMVTWRISSSNAWAYSSSRTGQMPVSRAFSEGGRERWG